MVLSVVILIKNEEGNILDCLEGVLGAEEILIIDDFSEDRTPEVIESLHRKNIKVLKHPLENDFSKQRNFALSKAKNDWVLFLDADERVSPELLEEIKNKIKSEQFDAYRIKRTDVMWGRKMRFGEVGNTRLVRLGKRKAGKWRMNVHEEWNVEGEVGDLDNGLTHYPHKSVKEFLSEINFYSSLRAKQLLDEDKRFIWYEIILFPKFKFFLNYFLKLGFMDGVQGLVLAIFMSFHSFLVRGKLWLLENNEKK